MNMQTNSYSDLQDHIRQIEMPNIETWQNQYADKEYTVDITISEFTAICPKTGLPDFAEIQISYVPNERCVELKSLKEYMFAYREIGIFHEHVVNKIMEDFIRDCQPRKVNIVGDFNIRGGIKTVVRANYEQPTVESE